MSENTRPQDAAAFPTIPPAHDNGRPVAGYPMPRAGMTLRDYFAAKALIAYMPTFQLGALSLEITDEEADEVAAISYRLADAMLRERAKA